MDIVPHAGPYTNSTRQAEEAGWTEGKKHPLAKRKAHHLFLKASSKI
jgi:hypothetical protein